MLFMALVSMTIAVVLILLNSLISFKKGAEREKGTPFECGFDPSSSARLPFSLHFFLLGVIFLIFDVEITLLLPMPLMMSGVDMMTWAFLSTMFVLILIGGTAHEWATGALDWSK